MRATETVLVEATFRGGASTARDRNCLEPGNVSATRQNEATFGPKHYS